MQYAELTEKVIGCAYTVFNGLGAGFLESVYEKALLIELRHAGLKAEPQFKLDVHYRGEQVGHYFADILVNDVLILELKAVESLAKAHEVQLVNYLAATGCEVGLLFNFGPSDVTVKRKTRTLKRPSRKS
ncbi:MAG: GxxExxY protein [Planctomycetota bacterium]